MPAFGVNSLHDSLPVKVEAAPVTGSVKALLITPCPQDGQTSLLPHPFVSSSLWQEDVAEDLNLDAADGAIHSVLYVEDSETNQQVMAALLERFPVSLTMAASALQGYEHIKNERFDVIFTDIQMPEYSGVDLNNWFKAIPGMNDHTPIYACTANVTKKAREHYEALGFSGVLVKPLTLSELQSFFTAFEHRSPT